MQQSMTGQYRHERTARQTVDQQAHVHHLMPTWNDRAERQRGRQAGKQAEQTHTMSPIFIVTLPDLWIRSFPILPDGSAGWRKYDGTMIDRSNASQPLTARARRVRSGESSAKSGPCLRHAPRARAGSSRTRTTRPQSRAIRPMCHPGLGRGSCWAVRSPARGMIRV